MRRPAQRLELFSEQGYDNTTVAQIAERAGLTKSTFFRHFPDKREVLFVGQDTLCQLFADGIAAAPSAATPLEAVAAALDAAAVAFTLDRRDLGPQRGAVIAGNTELQERDALKRASFAAAMTQALQEHGVPDPTASLAAELGVLAFKGAYARWADPTNQQEFGELARQSLQELQAASAALS
jgi:AcrR family transcriptional regulator